MKPGPARELLERCRWGVIFGVGIAGVYSSIVIVMFVATGGSSLDGRGLSLGGVLLTYLIGGVAGGTVFGVTAPLASTRIGAGVVGTLIMLPVFVGAAVLIPEMALGDRRSWAAIALAAILIGGGGTYSIWEPDWRR